MGATNYVILCSYLGKGFFSVQSPTFGTQGPTFREPTKKKKKDAKITKVFIEEWATQFPWAEHVLDPTSKTHMVHFKVCSLVENKDKILNPKLDGLHKHARKRKTLIFCLGVLVGESYINNGNQH